MFANGYLALLPGRRIQLPAGDITGTGPEVPRDAIPLVRNRVLTLPGSGDPRPEHIRRPHMKRPALSTSRCRLIITVLPGPAEAWIKNIRRRFIHLQVLLDPAAGGFNQSECYRHESEPHRRNT